ncbi:hypothetical protein XCR_1961 [Xanthomonas campestris pv. raphani 756C]|nr:hypothetical protein XCR_1961 [Xanthomonas campestris pv. raphani 756C]
MALPLEECEEVTTDLGSAEFGGCVHGLALGGRWSRSPHEMWAQRSGTT